MGGSRHEVDARRLVKQHGTFVRETKHSELWEVAGTRIGLPGGSPSDPRAWSNCLATIRRVLRSAGVEGSQIEEVEVRDDERARHAELGIHVETREMRVRRITKEATVALQALPRILELVPGTDCDWTLRVEDPEGREVQGPLKLTVTYDEVEPLT